jgi:hypothetical protein
MFRYYSGYRFSLPLLLASCLLLSAQLMSQNLVMNSGFESSSSCPSSTQQFNLVDDWFNPTEATTDYFNACAGFAAGVPSNAFGTQSAFEGSSYAGFVAWSDPASGLANYREYLGANLTDTLVSGYTYRVRIQLSLADNFAYYGGSIGVFFSDSSFHIPGTSYPVLGDAPYFMNPQIQWDDPVDDATGWATLEAFYIASGNESHLVIGNFENDSLTSVSNSGAGFLQQSYYFIDGIEVERVPLFPILEDDFSATDAVSDVLIPVLDNDYDLDGYIDASSLSIVDSAQFATLSIDGSGSGILFQPEISFLGAGIDSFQYQVCDDESNCDMAWVFVNESAILSGPLASDDWVTVLPGEQLWMDVSSNDLAGASEINGGLINILQHPVRGTAIVDSGLMQVSYFASAGSCNYMDSFSYEICDLIGLCDEAWSYIEVTCPPVYCVNDTLDFTAAGILKQVPVLQNDESGMMNWNWSSLQIIQAPQSAWVDISHQHGLLEIEAFQPLDSLQYQICNQMGSCAQAWVIIESSDISLGNNDVSDALDLGFPTLLSQSAYNYPNGFFIRDLEKVETGRLEIYNSLQQLVFEDSHYENNLHAQALSPGTCRSKARN